MTQILSEAPADPAYDALIIGGLSGPLFGATLSGSGIADLTPAQRAYLVSGIREDFTAINAQHAATHPGDPALSPRTDSVTGPARDDARQILCPTDRPDPPHPVRGGVRGEHPEVGGVA